MYLYSVRINEDDKNVYPIFQFYPTTFNMDNKLTIKSDDLKAIRNSFSNIKTMEIFMEDKLMAVFTCFDSYKDITFQSNMYDSTTGEWTDVLEVTLTKANIIEQVQRLDEQINYVPDIQKMELNEYKTYLQEKNKDALSSFLATQTVTYNGKEYGVSEEDQNEMALNLMQYQALSQAGQEVSLEWHSKKSKCETFSTEEFLGLTALIKEFVYPYYQQMQEIKERIFNAKTKEELSEIKIEYKAIELSE